MKVKDEVDLLVSDVVLHIFYKLETNEETPTSLSNLMNPHGLKFEA